MKLDSRPVLEFRQEQIKGQITAALALLEGQLCKSPSQRGHQLRRKAGGRTLARYVRKRLVPRVKAMIQNRRRLNQLLSQLSEVNWRLLQLPPEEPEEE